jgi:hypothetical protein
VARHRRTRGIVLPAALIGVLLFAATGATYEVVRVHDRAAAAQSVAGARLRQQVSHHRHHPVRRAGPGPPAARTLPPSPRPAGSPTPASPAPASPAPASPVPATTVPPTTGPAGGTEAAELGQITTLLRRSATIRTELNATTRAVASCALSTGGGLARIETVIRARTEVLDAAVGATVSAISGGARLRAELVEAMRYSLAADSQFADWLRDLSGWDACPVPTVSNSSYLAGLTDSTLAGAAKAGFLRQWNQLAASFGQPAFSAGQI